jgi:hypothetical protein
MANTVNGFVVIQIGSGTFTLTPADVSPAAAKAALTNLQVQYLADSLDDAVAIGTLGAAVAGAKSAANLIEDAFGFTGANAIANGPSDPSTLISSGFDSIATALGGIDSTALAKFKSDILGIVVKITQITIDVPNHTYTFGVGLDFSSFSNIPFPIQLKALSVTFSHTKS